MALMRLLVIFIIHNQLTYTIDFDGVEFSPSITPHKNPYSSVKSSPKQALENQLQVKNNRQSKSLQTNPEMRGLQWTRPEINLHGLKDAYSKHLGPTGNYKPPIFTFDEGTKAANQATINLVEAILNDPIEIQKGMGPEGHRYTGYLGEINAKPIEIRIAEQASNPATNGVVKTKVGELSTAVRLNEKSLKENWPNISRKNGLLVFVTQSKTNPVVDKNISPSKPSTSIKAFKNRMPRRLISGVKGASAIRAADLIPGREVVKEVYEGKPGEAVKTHLRDSANGLPIAAGAGLATAVMPSLVKVAGPVGGAMVIVQTGETLDEVVTQQTGETLVSKFRQAIGTRERTGISAPDYNPSDPNAELIIPTITKSTVESIAESERLKNRNIWQLRWDCIKERFNPSKLEFGISELLRGCNY